MSRHTSHNAYIILEFIGLFVLLPIAYWLDVFPFHKIIPLLLLFAYCVLVLIRHKQVNREKFALGTKWREITLRFLVIGIMIFLFISFYSDYPLVADLNKNRNLLYMLLMYPLLSAFPQELIFREFYFYRYGTLFRNKNILIGSNILLFAFAHIYFGSWIVIAFTLVGGLIFTLTFLKTRSLLAVTIEHSLYGLLILSSGLSVHFYKAF